MNDFRDPMSHALAQAVERVTAEMVEIRHDLHAHPELSWNERRTTAVVADRLEQAGVRVQRLPRSGLVADIGPVADGIVALRADLDALPINDLTTDDWRSNVTGVAHACGHDVHTAALLGAGLALAQVHEELGLPGRVRLLFQPAEEVMPGGALEALNSEVLDGITSAFALHCDPTLDVGEVGLRSGPITGATDSIRVQLKGRGGHTSRPHLTQDLTFALATVMTDLPAALSRRLDPRAGASMVWGMVSAGSAPNVIPDHGEVAGTLRMLDPVAWIEAEHIIVEIVHQLVAPFGVLAEVTYIRGVPPVVNDPHATSVLARAVEAVCGQGGVVSTTQSLGGEDFGWILDKVPGAMGRLGTRAPDGPTFDLHQGDLRVDDRSVGIGAHILAQVAYRMARG